MKICGGKRTSINYRKRSTSAIGASKIISQEILFQRLLSIVYTALSCNLCQFDYCNIVWGNCGKTLFYKLQKLQNRAARILTFSRYFADANRLFRQLNWKDLSTQFQIQGYLSSGFVKRYETRYSLRDSVNKLIVSFPRSNFMKTEQLQLQRSSSLEQPAL